MVIGIRFVPTGPRFRPDPWGMIPPFPKPRPANVLRRHAYRLPCSGTLPESGQLYTQAPGPDGVQTSQLQVRLSLRLGTAVLRAVLALY